MEQCALVCCTPQWVGIRDHHQGDLSAWISTWAPGSLPGYLDLQCFGLKMCPAKGKEHAI